MIKESILHLSRHLDDEPGDLLARKVLADAYDEDGRDDLAAFYRWTAEKNCWPATDYEEMDGLGRPGDWWWCRNNVAIVENEPCMLGDLWFEVNYVSRWPPVDTNRGYATRSEAEETLCKTLLRLGYGSQMFRTVEMSNEQSTIYVMRGSKAHKEWLKTQ